MTKFTQNLISLCTLGLKNFQITFHNIFTHQGLSNNTQSVAKFSYRFLVLIYMNFPMKTCSIFNDLKSKHGTLNTTIAKT